MFDVDEVFIPAYSTIGYARAVDENGKHVTLAGDHRSMRALGALLSGTGDGIKASAEGWQVLGPSVFDSAPGERYMPAGFHEEDDDA